MHGLASVRLCVFRAMHASPHAAWTNKFGILQVCALFLCPLTTINQSSTCRCTLIWCVSIDPTVAGSGSKYDRLAYLCMPEMVRKKLPVDTRTLQVQTQSSCDSPGTHVSDVIRIIHEIFKRPSANRTSP